MPVRISLRPICFEDIFLSFRARENVSKSDITQMIDALDQTNNQIMINTMKQFFQISLDDMKRLQAESSDAQIHDIKKIKTEEQKRFRKKKS